MRLFRRKKEFSTEKRLEEYFDIETAEIRYRLVLYHFWDGELCDCGFEYLGDGDKEWARKIAKHYDLTVTTPVWED